MASCPKCTQQVKDDFGLVTCGHCGASFFLDFDGNVMESAEGESSEPLHAENIREQTLSGEEPDELISSPEDLSSFPEDLESPIEASNEVESEDFEDWASDDSPIEPIESSPGTEWREDSLEEEALGEVELKSEGGLGESETNFSSSEPVMPAETTEEALKEVLTFANSPNMEANEGSLRYNLVIQSIDTKDLLKQVFEALEDERFLWDAEGLVSQTKSGVLRLSDLNAIKASLIVFRLRDVDVEVAWEQENIHD